MTPSNYMQNFPAAERPDPEIPVADGINSAQTPTGHNLLPTPVAHWLAEINRRVQALSKAQQQKQAE